MLFKTKLKKDLDSISFIGVDCGNAYIVLELKIECENYRELAKTLNNLSKEKIIIKNYLKEFENLYAVEFAEDGSIKNYIASISKGNYIGPVSQEEIRRINLAL